jgi:RimJ/RimL family protein N-acetyltransferase
MAAERPADGAPGQATQRPTVRIRQLDQTTLDALAAADLDRASAASGLTLTAFFVGPQSLGTWQRRSRQVREDPPAADWVTGVIVDAATSEPVGRAGFHGPPDADGRVEIGYAVDEGRRRRGYARAALEALLARADEDPRVLTVRATVRPDNEPSLALVRQYGFLEVGEQWDDEDGLELVLERPAGGAPAVSR